jgi:hypothetical protein
MRRLLSFTLGLLASPALASATEPPTIHAPALREPVAPLRGPGLLDPAAGSTPKDRRTPSPRPPSPQSLPDDQVVSGRVGSVAPDRIGLMHYGEPLYFDHSSTVLVHGQVASPTQLRPGDDVSASLDFRQGHHVVRTLSVLNR